MRRFRRGQRRLIFPLAPPQKITDLNQTWTNYLLWSLIFFALAGLREVLTSFVLFSCDLNNRNTSRTVVVAFVVGGFMDAPEPPLQGG